MSDEAEVDADGDLSKPAGLMYLSRVIMSLVILST
jgi:hypothetical protein